jgi:hypothetical protein
MNVLYIKYCSKLPSMSKQFLPRYLFIKQWSTTVFRWFWTVPIRCVPGWCVPWMMLPRDEASLGWGFPGMRLPWDEASLGWGFPGMRLPWDEASLGWFFHDVAFIDGWSVAYFFLALLLTVPWFSGTFRPVCNSSFCCVIQQDHLNQSSLTNWSRSHPHRSRSPITLWPRRLHHFGAALPPAALILPILTFLCGSVCFSSWSCGDPGSDPGDFGSSVPAARRLRLRRLCLRPLIIYCIVLRRCGGWEQSLLVLYNSGWWCPKTVCQVKMWRRIVSSEKPGQGTHHPRDSSSPGRMIPFFSRNARKVSLAHSFYLNSLAKPDPFSNWVSLVSLL